MADTITSLSKTVRIYRACLPHLLEVMRRGQAAATAKRLLEDFIVEDERKIAKLREERKRLGRPRGRMPG